MKTGERESALIYLLRYEIKSKTFNNNFLYALDDLKSLLHLIKHGLVKKEITFKGLTKVEDVLYGQSF